VADDALNTAALRIWSKSSCRSEICVAP